MYSIGQGTAPSWTRLIQSAGSKNRTPNAMSALSWSPQRHGGDAAFAKPSFPKNLPPTPIPWSVKIEPSSRRPQRVEMSTNSYALVLSSPETGTCPDPVGK